MVFLILFLSTIMLAGIGKVLKRELNIPVYGFLQGEDSFLDSLLPEYRVEAWKLLSNDIAKLDGCIAPSKYFGDLMSEGFLFLPRRLSTILMVLLLKGIFLIQMYPRSQLWDIWQGFVH